MTPIVVNAGSMKTESACTKSVKLKAEILVSPAIFLVQFIRQHLPAVVSVLIVFTLEPAETGGACYLCSIAETLTTRKEDCVGCGNRYWIRTSNNLGICFLCDGTVSADGTGCEWNCPDGQVGLENKCYDCSEPNTGTGSSLSSCNECSNRVYAGIEETGGQCLLCSYHGTISGATKDRCTNCSNRYWREGGACRLCTSTVTADGMGCNWNCPAGQVGSVNQCYDCYDTKPVIGLSSLSSCRQCSNRVYSGIEETGGTCDLCSLEYPNLRTRKEDCLACGNRYWREDGVCRLCIGTVTADGMGCE